VAGSTFLFLEAEPVSVRFRVAAVESCWAAALACLAEVHSLAAVPDFHAPVADSLARAVDFLELVAASWPVVALVCSLAVHCFARAADSPGQAVGSLERVGEPGVDLLVPAADFRAWGAALADSAVVHSHAPEADSRELAAPSGSPELARWRALVVDFHVPRVSQVVLRSAYLAALPAAFLLRAAAADWLAVLRLCLPAALELASHSTRCETRSVWVSSGQRE
jgi:hypothetical protein